MYYAQDARFERLALIIQKQLSEIGVDVEMQPVSHAEFGRRAAASDFDAFLNELNSGRSLSWVYYFWHSPVQGEPRFLDTGYTAADGALDRVRRATSDEGTRAAVAEVQRVLLEDPPAVFLVWPQVTRAVDVHFNVPPAETGDVLGSIWQWRRTPAVLLANR
jgi:ABC-type transport system substrate-binding protein